MAENKPLVDGQYLLEKYPGKGGWTYAAIPEIAQNPNNPFGWVKVKGSIDGYELKQYKLMPMGEGTLIFTSQSRHSQKNQEGKGDSVHIILYLDENPLEIPEEIIECFKTESQSVYETFLSFSEGERKTYLDWIYDAKTDETKTQRIVTMMERLQQGLTFRE